MGNRGAYEVHKLVDPRSQKPTPRDFMPPPPHAPFEHFILNAARLRVREAIHKVRAMRRVGQGTG